MSVIPFQPGGMSQIFGTDTDRIRAAVETGLKATQDAALNAHAAAGGRSERRYTLSYTRLDQQFDHILDEIKALKVPDFQALPPGGPGVWYKLAYLHGALLLPVHVERPAMDGPGAKWPRQPVPQIIKELFAIDRRPPRWTADTFDDVESPVEREEIALRAALEDLPTDSRLVLIPFTMTFSGITGAWWGEAKLLNDAGDLQWLIKPEMLRVARPDVVAGIPLQPVEAPRQSTSPDNSFASGALPTSDLVVRSPEELKQRGAPKTEAEDSQPDVKDNGNH
ncbi:hypothetical protein ACFY20_35700 [Streptomyces sp. NPDC001312]|uniref:hypothetical protein n=1 Tax=Streptomyces sp. NPDC001312 TaxID=3364561 RepID=UPI0036B3D710